MKFFIPLSNDNRQMERLYRRISGRMSDLGYGPFYQRTYQIVFRRHLHLLVATVGDVCPLCLETVLAILKNDRGYLIVTYSRGAAGGEPIVIQHELVEATSFFDPKDHLVAG